MLDSSTEQKFKMAILVYGSQQSTFILSSLVVFVILHRLTTCLSVAAVDEASKIHSHRKENTKERASDGGSDSRQHPRDAGEHRTEFDHEAILGSRDIAEEFDHLPPDVAKERLRVLAMKMDKDGDGQIRRDELQDWILHSFKMLNKEDAEERHEESDSDSDGYVSWEEYVEENYGIGGIDEENPELDVDAMAEERRMMQEDRDLFRAADEDGDRRLNKAEFLAFSHPEEFRHTGEVLSQRTIEDRDVDGDGYISFEEFLGEEARGKDEEWRLSERVKFDGDYDRNGDGKLDSSEVLLWLAPDDRESAEQEAEHLIQSSDENHDDVLDLEEIVRHHDVFVGSEATDYGQHLHNPHKFSDEL